jgi:hypothetical protein
MFSGFNRTRHTSKFHLLPSGSKNGSKHRTYPPRSVRALPQATASSTAGPCAGAARGFDLEPVALTNRANDPEPSAQLVWKKCEADGLIVSRLGVLENDLAKVWQPDQAHVAVRQLRDWFVQYPYLSKLRDPQVLARPISEALARGADTKYAIADRFDEQRASTLA